MMKRIVLCLVLAGALSGCRLFGEKRPTPDTCPSPGPAPTAPPVTELPVGTPPPPGASHVVALLCTETGAFHAAGVNVNTRSFTYLVSGTRAGRQSFLDNAYRAGVPVVLYTAPVKVRGTRGSGGSAAMASGATSTDTSSSDDGETLDPCFDGNEIGDKPPETDKDPGNATSPAPTPLDTFAQLAWSSATAVDGITDPAAVSPGTRPAPGTTVPR